MKRSEPAKKEGIVRVKLYVNSGYVGANHVDYVEFTREEWDSMSKKEQEDTLEEMAQDFMGNHIEYGAYVVDDLDDEDEDEA